VCRERRCVAPNGLAFSGRLEGITLIDRNRLSLRLDAKIAPIQLLRCNAGLGADLAVRLRL
jgi:hypothetical protein